MRKPLPSYSKWPILERRTTVVEEFPSRNVDSLESPDFSDAYNSSDASDSSSDEMDEHQMPQTQIESAPSGS